MKNHVKVYMNHFDYVVQEEIPCEACTRPAVDIHHIWGRGKDKDVIDNLMALCRRCHDKTGIISKDEFQMIHNYFLMGNRKIYLK